MKTLKINDCDKYRVLSETLDRGILFTDFKGSIYDYNSYLVNLLALDSKTTLKGQNFFSFLDPKEQKLFYEPIVQLTLNTTYHCFISCFDKTQYPLEIKVTKCLIDHNPFLVFIIAKAVDPKNLNPYKLKSLSEYEKSNVIYAMEIASSYLASLNQRITAPLAKIKNYISLIEKEMNIYGLTKFAKDLKQITTFTGELNNIMNDLSLSPLAILSQEKGCLENINLAELIEEVSAVVAIIAKRKNISLVTLYPPDIGKLYTHRQYLFYGLINILDNIFHDHQNSYVSFSVLRKKDFFETINFEINISSIHKSKRLTDSKNIAFAKECLYKLNGTLLENELSQDEKLIALQIPVL